MPIFSMFASALSIIKFVTRINHSTKTAYTSTSITWCQILLAEHGSINLNTDQIVLRLQAFISLSQFGYSFGRGFLLES